MLVREEYTGQILDRMASLRTYIETKNGSGYYDSNKYAENFYAGLLNRIYGWNLENANEVYENAPGIDLIDVENQIVVQVSTTSTTTKIHLRWGRLLPQMRRALGGSNKHVSVVG